MDQQPQRPHDCHHHGTDTADEGIDPAAATTTTPDTSSLQFHHNTTIKTEEEEHHDENDDNHNMMETDDDVATPFGASESTSYGTITATATTNNNNNNLYHDTHSTTMNHQYQSNTPPVVPTTTFYSLGTTMTSSSDSTTQTTTTNMKQPTSMSSGNNNMDSSSLQQQPPDMVQHPSVPTATTTTTTDMTTNIPVSLLQPGVEINTATSDPISSNTIIMQEHLQQQQHHHHHGSNNHKEEDQQVQSTVPKQDMYHNSHTTETHHHMNSHDDDNNNVQLLSSPPPPTYQYQQQQRPNHSSTIPMMASNVPDSTDISNQYPTMVVEQQQQQPPPSLLLSHPSSTTNDDHVTASTMERNVAMVNHHQHHPSITVVVPGNTTTTIPSLNHNDTTTPMEVEEEEDTSMTTSNIGIGTATESNHSPQMTIDTPVLPKIMELTNNNNNTGIQQQQPSSIMDPHDNAPSFPTTATTNTSPMMTMTTTMPSSDNPNQVVLDGNTTTITTTTTMGPSHGVLSSQPPPPHSMYDEMMGHHNNNSNSHTTELNVTSSNLSGSSDSNTMATNTVSTTTTTLSNMASPTIPPNTTLIMNPTTTSIGTNSNHQNSPFIGMGQQQQHQQQLHHLQNPQTTMVSDRNMMNNNSNNVSSGPMHDHHHHHQLVPPNQPNQSMFRMNYNNNNNDPQQQHGIPSSMQQQQQHSMPMNQFGNSDMHQQQQQQQNVMPQSSMPPPSSGTGYFSISNTMNNSNIMGTAQQQLPPNDMTMGSPPQNVTTPSNNNNASGGGGGGGMRELRVEDALLYLDDVKREFKDRPAIYNEFLAIMKNFKSQEVDTPGVIDRVSKLFRGYNNLILGFNTFLPDGCKISLADLERAEAQRVAEEQAAQLQAQIYAKVKKPKGQGGAKRGPKPNINHPLSSGKIINHGMNHTTTNTNNVRGGPIVMGHHHGTNAGYPPNNNSGPLSESMTTTPGNWNNNLAPDSTLPMQQQQSHMQVSSPPPQQQQPPPQQHQAVEFDHAISYVTTIKKRFASDPNTYHSFLEILHTYQKEQRGIKEVLEQVAHLFQDHPDLLKEFTFFLPDAVQEQAKERLHRAAAESESRINAQRQQQQMDRYGTGNQQRATDIRNGIETSVSPTTVGRASGVQRASIAQPETYIYNSAVERQFFDSARESLTSYSRDSGQAWAEFLKCLDMYAQEILSRTEMLNFVEPLLGKRNSNLFEEFKRILSAAGSLSVTSTQLMDDAWYSVPLAEIDFGRCRRCTPSYRALPRDYPAPPCSERSEFESKILNDIWVSLPVGSEESYTFRHMRRNTYEETLFRVEDERFEIDMVIDSNAATLQRLEPIAKEIALLAQEDIVPFDLGIKPPLEAVGLGGKRYQYTFDKKLLGVVHRNAIARIYGDNGLEMLDLLVRNPTVAVPLVVQRLRQKDTEWRVVRDRLNKHWKDLAEHNYYKSLDHRSLTWRTIDKRALSARILVAEIKDRASNHGRESREAYRQRLEKAKEEHGNFFEVTVGEKLSSDFDLTFLPKPDRRLFTPHLTLNFKNVSWAQRDAYRILAFALERGPISPADKERCHRLWVEFLGPWFDLSFNWMQKPAVTYQESTLNTMKILTLPTATTTSRAGTGLVSGRSPSAMVVSEDDEESLDDDPELVRLNGGIVSDYAPMVNHGDKPSTSTSSSTNPMEMEYTDHHPLPAGAHVSTLYGVGKIIEFRRRDHIYKVRLGFGAVGYLRPATVLCSVLPVEKSAYTRQLRTEDRTRLARPNDQLCFGTQNLYLFFRLHEILVRRLNIAKQLAYSVSDDLSLQSMVEQMPNVNPKVVGRRRYEAFLSLVYSLLDGGVGGASSEGGKYEDRVRSLLGHQAYELATMDKLIANIWKDIQTMANDDTMWSLIQLYRRHVLAGSFQPEAFRLEAAYLSDGEPMFAFQHCPLSSSDESIVHVEYLGIMEDHDIDDDDDDDDDNNANHHGDTTVFRQIEKSSSSTMDVEKIDVSTATTHIEPSNKRQKR